MATLTFFVLIIFQAGWINSCTFFYSDNEHYGTTKYISDNVTKEDCLKSCYYDLDCDYILYDGAHEACFVYMEGGIEGTSGVYVIDRSNAAPMCPGTNIKLAPAISFKPIPGETIVIDASDCPAEMASVRVDVFENDLGYHMYCPRPKILPHRGFTKKATLQFFDPIIEACDMIPVFMRDGDYHRLFFGEHYDTEGYTFLGGYAAPHNCTRNDNWNCWIAQKMYEFKKVDADDYVYLEKKEENLESTDVTQGIHVQDYYPA